MARPLVAHLVASLGAVVLCSAAPAQGRVWIVDAAGGAGSHFTDLPPALKIAQDGDTVLVREGSYGGGTITKGIAVIADAGAEVLVRPESGVALAVHGLRTGQSAVLQGMSPLQNPPWLPPLGKFLSVTECAGRVHIDRVSMSAYWQGWWGIEILSSSHVTVHRAKLDQGLPLVVSDSTVVVTDSTLDGGDEPGFRGPFALPGMVVTRSSVTLSRTDVTGGDGYWHGGKPAVDVSPYGNTQLVVTGTSATRLAAGYSGVSPDESAIAGGPASAVVDPRVRVEAGGPGVPPIAPGISATIERVPGMAASGAPPGGVASFELHATSGDLAEIYLSLPAGPFAPPVASWGPIWVDFGALLVLGRFAVPPSETVGSSFTVPKVASLQGVPIALQALTVSASAGFRFSTPATPVLN